MAQDDGSSRSEPVALVWLLIHLQVDGEQQPVSLTMPVPMIDGQTLEKLRHIYAWSPPMIEARLESLYGIG
jgi:hypothetical protein